jgi:hypothetical protein
VQIPRFARARFAAAAALALLLLAGCGGAKTFTVTGKLVLPPKVKVADADSVNIILVPEDAAEAASGKSATLAVNPKDLTFSGTVSPGKYKVGLAITPYAGMKDSETRTKELNQNIGKFNTGATPLRYEVTGDANITVDFAASTVK